MAKGSRAVRVAELVRAEIGTLLSKGVKDPRVGFVSIMAVKMSSDLRYASVYVSAYGSEREKKSSLIGLQRASGWIRREIGRKLRLRATPEIRFFQDTTLDDAFRLGETLKRLHKEESEMITQVDLAGALDRLRGADSFLLTCHVGPDGDAIGSVLALAGLLRALGKEEITCACHDPVPKLYDWLPGAETFKLGTELSETVDLLVICDVARFERIGSVADAVPSNQQTLVLDHHLEEKPEGTHYFIDAGYASASGIIVDLFEAASLPIPYDAAVAAYVGLATDTGGFRFSNTNPKAHARAGQLISTGIDVFDITTRVFDTLSRPKFELLRHALNRMTITCGGSVAYTSITLADMKECKASSEDIEGIVNYGRNVEGVTVGVLFRETDESTVKVSLRSRAPFNSAEVLKPLGGGGHAGAAGVTLQMNVQEAQDLVLNTIEEALKVLAGDKSDGAKQDSKT